jgi:hypothetical protein
MPENRIFNVAESDTSESNLQTDEKGWKEENANLLETMGRNTVSPVRVEGMGMDPWCSPFGDGERFDTEEKISVERLQAEVKSLTKHLSTIISHRNDLLNTIETSNITIQELQDTIRLYEAREKVISDNETEKDSMIEVLQQQLRKYRQAYLSTRSNDFGSPSGLPASSYGSSSGSTIDYFDTILQLASGDDDFDTTRKKRGVCPNKDLIW